ncbi:hypothetical protein Trydic_g9827 [Trypoxylus dichotomus]
MTEIDPDNDTAINRYYLPHHGVIKMDSTTTKLRVVFDASVKTSSGLSLKDVLKRKEPDDTLKHYRLNTVTYGTASASFLAARALHQAATDSEVIYPKASKIIKEHFYVDDLISGADTTEQAITLQHQIEEILCGACLPAHEPTRIISKSRPREHPELFNNR